MELQSRSVQLSQTAGFSHLLDIDKYHESSHYLQLARAFTGQLFVLDYGANVTAVAFTPNRKARNGSALVLS